MTEAADVATKEAYEDAIRSFTEAEIALREIVTALQRFRSASDLVAEAGTSLAEAQAAVESSSRAVETAVVTLTAIAASLGSAAHVIAAIDPARFWESFDRLEASVASSATTLQEAIGAGFTQADARQTAAAQAVDTHIATTGEVLGGDIRAATAELGSLIMTSGERLATRIGETSDANQKTTQEAAAGLASAIGAAQHLATQVRALAIAGVVIGLGAVALLVLLLFR